MPTNPKDFMTKTPSHRTWPRGAPKLLSSGYNTTPDDLIALGQAAKQLGPEIWHQIRQKPDGSFELWRDGHGFLDTKEEP